VPSMVPQGHGRRAELGCPVRKAVDTSSPTAADCNAPVKLDSPKVPIASHHAKRANSPCGVVSLPPGVSLVPGARACGGSMMPQAGLRRLRQEPGQEKPPFAKASP
jgi:hypothetical protein